jgi:hypothetical protein
MSLEEQARRDEDVLLIVDDEDACGAEVYEFGQCAVSCTLADAF